MVGAGEGLIEREVASAEHGEKLQEEFVDAHCDHGETTAIGIGFDGEGQFLEAGAEFRGGLPNGLVGMTEDVSQLVEVVLTENEPWRPFPFLVGAANADIEDEEVEAAGRDVGVANAMEFPGAIDSEVVGLEGIVDAFGGEAENAVLEESEFESFIAMPSKAPSLVFAGVPVANCLEAW